MTISATVAPPIPRERTEFLGFFAIMVAAVSGGAGNLRGLIIRGEVKKERKEGNLRRQPPPPSSFLPSHWRSRRFDDF